MSMKLEVGIVNKRIDIFKKSTTVSKYQDGKKIVKTKVFYLYQTETNY